MLNPHCLLCLVSHFNYFSTTIQRFGEHSSKVFKDENGWKRACALPRWSSQVDVLTTMIRTVAHNFKDKLINLCGNEHQRANILGRAPPPFSAWCISPDLTPKRFFSTPMHCNDEWDMSSTSLCYISVDDTLVGQLTRTCLMCVNIVILSYNGCTLIFQATSTARSLRSIIDPIGDFRQLRRFDWNQIRGR